MVHLTSARLALRTDPDAAVAALDEAELHGRQSMNDIRSVVRLMRDDDAPSRLAPAEFDDVGVLIDQYRSGGADITLDSDLAPAALASVASLAAYRVVQEGLNNAVRHGDGAISVELGTIGDAAGIVVTNPTRRPSAKSDGGSGSRDARTGRRTRRISRVRPDTRCIDVAPHGEDSEMIRVLLVDDQALIREGMRRVIDTDPDLTVVGECADGDEVVDAVHRADPDVVVMDIRMKRMDGATATAELNRIGGPPVLASYRDTDPPHAPTST